MRCREAVARCCCALGWAALAHLPDSDARLALPRRCLLYLWTKADGAEATSARTALEPVCDSILASAQELRNAREREERAGCADAGEPDQAPSGKAVTRVFYTSEDAPGGTLAASSGPIACPGPGAGVLLDDAITDAKGVYARSAWRRRVVWGCRGWETPFPAQC